MEVKGGTTVIVCTHNCRRAKQLCSFCVQKS